MEDLKYIENEVSDEELNELNYQIDKFAYDNNVSIEDVELVHDAFIKGFVIAHRNKNLKNNGVDG